MASAAVVALLANVASAQTASLEETSGTCQLSVNCITNPSLENADDTVGTALGWRTNAFGTSDAAFTTTTGRTDSTAAAVTVASYSGNQDAKWVFNEVTVVGGQFYVFSDWYKSTTATEIRVFFTGETAPSNFRLMEVPASESPDTWTQVTAPGFLVPTGATRMTVAHSLVGAGTLTTDDSALTLQPSPVFRHGLVSLSFDDGWKSVYDIAIPILDEAGIRSTQYIHTDPVILNPERYARNMSQADLLSMQSKDHEIGAHTRRHLDLTEMTDPEERRREILGSRTDLLGAGIETVDTFAYTFGKHNAELRAIVEENFVGARTTETGYNTTQVDKYSLKSQVVLRTTTDEEINGWIDYAISNNFWVIITFHRVEKTMEECTLDPGSEELDPSCTDVATLRAVVEHMKGLPDYSIATVHEVLSDEELWTLPPEQVLEPPADIDASDASFDPPSSYAGERVTIEYAMNLVYAAGFRTEEQILTAVGVGIGESDLWTNARNWHPELDLRPAKDVIGLEGPKAVWSSDRRQMSSDRGLFQISSNWWPQFTDAVADDPVRAAAAFFEISKQGTDFSIWDSIRSGRAQSHFDEPLKGFPALRPLVKDFLRRVSAEEVAPGLVDASLGESLASNIPVGFTDQPATFAEDTNDETTITALQRAADAGNSWAQIGLAELLLDGTEVTPDPEQAIRLLEQASAAGLGGPALGTLGAYYQSIGDSERALAAFETAAAANNDWATFRLANMIMRGQGTTPDPERALQLWQQAADSGLRGPASKALGDYYLGTGDHPKALAAFEQASEAGEAEAKLSLADMLTKGTGTAPDPQGAIALLEQAAEAGFTGPTFKTVAEYYRGIGNAERALTVLKQASEAGEAEAKLILAGMFLRGEGTDVDPEQAITLLEEAAVHAEWKGPALEVLGTYYLAINHQGKAAEALEQAVEAGEAGAKLALGRMLLDEGQATDVARAKELLEQASGTGLSAAQTVLGKHYRTVGETAKALVALNQASDAGDAEAKLALADILLESKGTAADPVRAVELLHQAATAGLAGPAFRAIGDYYLRIGEYGKALAALERASAAGEAEAKLALANMLIKGEGTDPDPERAITLLEEAADAGFKGPTFKAIAEYYRGSRDNEHALTVLEQASSAGEIEAKVMLADMLIKGEGTAPDPERAIALLDEAAASGSEIPPFRSVAEYYRGIGEIEHALVFLERASAAGEAEAKLELGEVLIERDAAAGDAARAITLLEQAAEAGLIGPARRVLGKYYRGLGDTTKALTALQQAVDAADAEAMLLLADMLIRGEGPVSDPDRAIVLLQRAAAEGSTGPALRALGDYYLSIGNREQAVSALKKAANAGDGGARVTLAGLLMESESSEDFQKARELLRSAVDQSQISDAYARLIELATAEFRNEGALDMALSLLKDAHSHDESIALTSLGRLQPNSRMAIVQAILRDRKLYNGPVDGVWGRGTMRAIGKFCSDNAIRDCRSETMPVALLTALLSYL